MIVVTVVMTTYSQVVVTSLPTFLVTAAVTLLLFSEITKLVTSDQIHSVKVTSYTSTFARTDVLLMCF